jgi:hypothetical protein
MLVDEVNPKSNTLIPMAMVRKSRVAVSSPSNADLSLWLGKICSVL